MTDPRQDQDDLETLRAIAEGQGIDPQGMSAEQLTAALREAGVGEGGAGGRQRLDPDEGGRPQGEYGGEGVGRRESAGGPAAASEPEAESEPDDAE